MSTSPIPNDFITKLLLRCPIMHNLQMNFSVKEIVWGKVKNSPWWPAQISKLPDDRNSCYKVSFFGEQTFAFLEGSALRNYSEYYQEYAKKKSNKLLKAIDLADEAYKKKSQTEGRKAKQKGKKKVVETPESQSEENSEVHSKQRQKEDQSAMMGEELEYEPVDRSKIDNIQSQLQKILNKTQQSHLNYFSKFNTECLNCEQLLQSNVMRMVKLIKVKKQKSCVKEEEINGISKISEKLQQRIMSYLTNTQYYDNYLKVIKKNKDHKAQIENTVRRLCRKQYGSRLRKEYLQLFVEGIGNQTYNNINFQYEEFIKHVKSKKYDFLQHLTNKTSTLKFAQSIINRYQ